MMNTHKTPSILITNLRGRQKAERCEVCQPALSKNTLKKAFTCKTAISRQLAMATVMQLLRNRRNKMQLGNFNTISNRSQQHGGQYPNHHSS